uniref:ZAD domain-containing protein n=1 Tax=Stomoxys calcitrans TaxID=35570 RepID=A0A1I8NTW7_STOCA
MDFQSNLEFLCRVCAANTKGKNSVAECVYILKTPGLRDKLDKFLYLKIFENDALPKVLCKSCFRQVEATASLSKIAKHTQQVFRDFLFSSLPKGTSTTTNAAPTDNSNSTEYTSSDFLSKKDAQKAQKPSELPAGSTVATTSAAASVTHLVSPPPPPAPPTLQNLIPAGHTTPRKDDVIVNVSVSDPLTRENQQKVISHSQRRHSIMIEASSAAAFANLAQMQQKKNATVNSGRKSSSPARVLNYCPIAPKNLQASQQPTQITTFSSGGYVIGPVKPPTIIGPEIVVAVEKDSAKKTTTPLAPGTAITVKDNTILQQKRKNLVKALNNIKANSTGQVSLLKSAQPKQQSLLISNQMPLEQSKQAIADELPDRIIIAAPKNKQASTGNKVASKPSEDNIVTTALPANTTVTVTTTDTASASNASSTAEAPKAPSFPEDILLGRVIRDIDLLKLILKALKWPVNKQNMELQLQRLKNTRFTDIMSDSNLLQDTDLTQLLGPYLAPVLMAAQALQQQQQLVMKNPTPSASKKTNVTTNANNSKSANVASAMNSKPISLDPTAEEINKAMPYKLPPETSVQLVPALPEEMTQSIASKRSLTKETPLAPATANTAKRQRKSNTQKHRDSIVISDDDNEEVSAEKSQKPSSRPRNPVNNFEIDLSNPSFLAQLSLLNGSSSELANEALMALLQKQRVTMSRQQKPPKRRHNSLTSVDAAAVQNSNNANEFDALINIDDDIVLMEPVTTTTTAVTNKPATSTTVVAAADALKTQAPTTGLSIDLNNFVMPGQMHNTAPLITRPIIKRRKTVIQSSRANSKDNSLLSTMNKDLMNKSETTQTSAIGTNLANVEKLKEKDLQSPAKAASGNEVMAVCLTSGSTETSPSKQGSRKQQNKSALGQQLLEAIGLQKINSKASLPLQYIAAAGSATSMANSSDSSNVASLVNTKQSVQQIRSALKRSLKQAQEKQEMRSKEISSTVSTTVIQDADSTTKPAIKEIVIEHRSNKVSNSSSSNVDVEEQIDKITLVKSQNTPATQTTLALDKAETKKEQRQQQQAAKKRALTAARITERRCTLPSSVGRGRFTLNTKVDKEKALINGPAETIVVAETKEPQEKEKINSDNMVVDGINVSSSNITSTEVIQTKDEGVTAPRRRGRKRNADKIDANKTESGSVENDKEKENGKQQKDKENHNEKDKEKEKDTSKDKDKDNNNGKEKDKENQKGKDKDYEKDSKSSLEKSKALEKNKDEQDETSSNLGRPTRQSKTQSKYYKGPDKVPAAGRRSLPARSTRNRKYT